MFIRCHSLVSVLSLLLHLALSLVLVVTYHPSAMVQNLIELLERAAKIQPSHGISFYLPGRLEYVEKHITYSELLRGAKENAQVIRNLSPSSKSVVLLHFDNHIDDVKWLWAVLIAGRLPAISTPITNDDNGRRRHLLHLKTLLDEPIVLTTNLLRSEFASVDGLNVHTIEDARTLIPTSRNSGCCFTTSSNGSSSSLHDQPDELANADASISDTDAAILMLTSGSSGNAESVVLRHGQVLEAIGEKSLFHKTSSDDAFLN